VVGQPLQVLAEAVRIEGLDDLDDPRVESLPPVPGEAAIRDILGEGVLEGVLQLRKQSRLVEKLRGLQAAQAGSQRVLPEPGDRAQHGEGHGPADDRGHFQDLSQGVGKPLHASEDGRLDGVGHRRPIPGAGHHDARPVAAHRARLLERSHQFLDEEGIALRLLDDERPELRRQIVGAEQPLGDAERIGIRQGGQRQARVKAPIAGRRAVAGTAAQEEQNPLGGDAVDQSNDPVLGGRIAPVHVLQHHHVRPQRHAPLEQEMRRPHDGLVPPLGVHGPHRGVTWIDRQKVAQIGQGLPRVVAQPPHTSLDLLHHDRLGIAVVDAEGAAQHVDEGMKRYGAPE
jgi:hypothetical protein